MAKATWPKYNRTTAGAGKPTLHEFLKPEAHLELELRELRLFGHIDMADDTPWEVEQGLEPEYDCPDCDFYKTGLTISPQKFLEHLQEDHGYSHSEAWDIFDG